MSNAETWHDGVTHEGGVDRLGNDAILTHLFEESKQPHTPEEKAKIQQEIDQRIIDILHPTNKSEDK